MNAGGLHGILVRYVRKKSYEYSVKLTVLGHIDSGKSTIIGQMIYKYNGYDERTL